MQKKLVRSSNVVFVEDQTIQDIEKTNVSKFDYSDDIIDLDPTPLSRFPTQVEDCCESCNNGETNWRRKTRRIHRFFTWFDSVPTSTRTKT